MTPTLVMTRAQGASERFAAAVQAGWGQPIDVVICPGLRIEEIADVDLPAFDHLILTSQNAVRWAQARGLQADQVFCVGDQTAEAAAGLGAVQTAGGDADDLLRLILNRQPVGVLLHLSGEHQRFDLAAKLRSLGKDAETAIVYRQPVNSASPKLIGALRGPNPVLAPVFSARSALIFQGVERQTHLIGVAISSHVADALDALGFDQVITSDHPTAEAVQDATLRALSKINQSRI